MSTIDSCSVNGSRVRRRDQFKSFVSSKSQAIKQYYATPSSSSSSSSITEREMDSNLKRSDTQEIDDILKDSTPEIVQPQCMLFPTYACQYNAEDQESKYKIVLAGWAFAQPGSSRLDRWLLGIYLCSSWLNTDSNTIFFI